MIDAYENYYKYNLSADPFRLGPDHRFAFPHASYAKARAYLEFAIRRGEGFITITGAPGTGKTTLINEIVASIGDASVLLATLNSTQLESRDLLHMVAAAFGLRYGDVSKATLLLGLEEFLTQQQRKNKRAVLIVDEAQGLSSGAIEELRLLANLQCQNRLLLQVVLVGQEHLRDLVKAPGMEHLSQRIIVATYLEPLSLPDTVTYIEHRLKKVRWRGDPAITEDALRLIYRFSGGVPRRINLICSRLFLFGGLEGTHELTTEDAQTVIADLQQEALLPGEPLANPGGGEAAQTPDPAGLPLSLPREAPADPSGAAQRAEELHQACESAGHPGGDAQAKRGRSPACGEPEDILSSRKPLREALGQVCSTLEAEEQDRSPPRRPPPRSRQASGETGRQSKPVTARSVPRDAPRADDTATLKVPGTPNGNPGKRRNLTAFLVVAVGLLLAFGLVRLTRDEAPPNSAAMTLPSDSPTFETGSREEFNVTGDANVTDMAGAEDALSDRTEQDTGTTVHEEMASGVEDPRQRPEAPEPETLASLGEEAPPPIDDRGDTPAADVASTGVDSSPAIAAPDAETPVTPLTRATDDRADAATVQRTPDSAPRQIAPVVKVPQAPAAPDRIAAVTPSVQPEPVALPAANDTSSPAPKVTGTQTGRPSPAEIDTQRARLAQAARERFDRQLAQAETEAARGSSAGFAPAVSPAPAAAPPGAPRASQSRPAQPPPQIKPSVPKVAVASPTRPAVPTAKPATPVNSPDRIKAALLEGEWTSAGKPAALLPSDVTLCRDERTTIACWSVPKNINTKFGEALYKVEARLQDFSASGDFRIAYRTLVRLVGQGAADKNPADPADQDWQVSEYTTSCRLTFPNQVSCRDQKGVEREYRR